MIKRMCVVALAATALMVEPSHAAVQKPKVEVYDAPYSSTIPGGDSGQWCDKGSKMTVLGAPTVQGAMDLDIAYTLDASNPTEDAQCYTGNVATAGTIVQSISVPPAAQRVRATVNVDILESGWEFNDTDSGSYASRFFVSLADDSGAKAGAGFYVARPVFDINRQGQHQLQVELERPSDRPLGNLTLRATLAYDAVVTEYSTRDTKSAVGLPLDPAHESGSMWVDLQIQSISVESYLGPPT